MKKYKQLYAGIVTCIAMILISLNAMAQKRQIQAFEKIINQAIQKAYLKRALCRICLRNMSCLQALW